MKEQTRHRKRPYGGLQAVPVAVLGRTSLLSASVVQHSTIQTEGQETGPVFDYGSGYDGNTGKEFNQDWDFE